MSPDAVVVAPDAVSAYIDGRNRHGAVHELPDPATGEIVARIGWATPEDVDAALSSASASGETWAQFSPRKRADALRACAQSLHEHSHELTALIVQETGKRQSEALAEVLFSAQYFSWFAEAAVAHLDRSLVTPERRFLVTRQPVGVVAAVAPWNFPLSIPARKVAAALAAGCPVVLKPSELTPRSGLALAEIVQEHVPLGLISALVGDGESLTNALIDDPRVKAISFTGSTRVGTLVAQRAANNGTRTVLELGGRAAFIIGSDVASSDAADTLMVAKFRNNGASCIAANNVFVHESSYDEIVSALRDRIAGLEVGSPVAETTDLGPMIRPAERDRLEALVAQARTAGARVTRGDSPQHGWFVAPTLIEVQDAEVQAWSEEIFGPVCVVKPFADLDEVIAEVNGWNSGLAGYVMSSDSELAMSTASRLRVGIVGINNGAPNSPDVPFGGFGTAGVGREGGIEGMLAFTETQTISSAR